MKRMFVATIPAVLLLMAAVFFPSKAPLIKATGTVRAQEVVPCSLASAAGNFGGNLNGTLILPTGPVPVAAVVRITADSTGTLSFTEARNVGGSFANETATGTWTVNPDCTGTATFQVFDEKGRFVRSSTLSSVLDDHMRELRFVQESFTLPDGTNVPVVISGEGRKM